MANGKRIALWGCVGCGGFVALVVLILIGTSVVIGYKAVQFGKGVGQTYRETAERYRVLDQENPFVAPDDGIMDDSRLRTFLRIRKEVSESIHEKGKAVEDFGDRIGEQMERPGVISKIRGIASVKDIIGVAALMPAEIGQFHIQLLDVENMSTREFQWIAETFLGTLAKAAEKNQGGLLEHWERYLDKFELARKKINNVHMDIGHTRINGDDMNRRGLMETLEKTPYNSPNVEIVAEFIDQLLPNDEEALFDYLALHLDAILEEVGKDSGASP